MDTPKSGFSTRGLRSARIRSPKGTVLNRSSPLPVTYRHPALLSETTGFGWALRDAKCGRQALSEGEDSEWMGVTGVREEGRISQQGQKHRRQCVATYGQGSRVQVPPVPFFYKIEPAGRPLSMYPKCLTLLAPSSPTLRSRAARRFSPATT